MKRCFIFCAGDRTELLTEIGKNDLVIAADGGLDHAKEMGISPDVLVGDFDSLKLEDNELKALVKKGIEVVKYPAEKDETDTEIAVKLAIQKNCDEIILLGAAGGKRIDHMIANIGLLSYAAECGKQAYMFDGRSSLTVVKEGIIIFDASCSGNLSVFAFGGAAEGVSEEGLKYSLQNARLAPNVSLGASNHFTGKASRVSVKRGSLLIVGEFVPEQVSVRGFPL